ncbi:MAG: hypothetical protein M0036_20070 [Desulfobacteraceae bacterium]|nr:hypothetical protein [Desulfobacteraceae bacterium]
MAHQLHINQITPRDYSDPWNPDQQLIEALAERARFLEKYPQYQSFQNEIDELLDKAGTAENRMAVLALLMEAKLIEMHDQFRQLNHILLRVKG